MRIFFISWFMLLLLNSCNSNQSSPLVFVSYPASQAIEQIDIAEQKLVRRTTVGMLPHNMLLDAQTKRLYVVVVGSQAVAEVDAETGDLLRTFPTEAVPMARENGRPIQGHVDQNAAAHTTCFDCHRGGEGGVAPAIVGARPFGIAASADGQTLFVANGRSRTLAVIDVSSGTLKKNIPLEATGPAHEPTGLVRVGEFLYVTLRPSLPSYDSAVVRKIDLQNWAVIEEIATGANAGVLAANVTQDEIYVSNSESNTIARLTPATEYIGNYVVGAGPLGLLATPDGKELISANYYNNSVSIIDLKSNQMTTHPMEYNGNRYANPTQIALDENATTAYVISGGTNGYILILDLISRNFTGAMPIGGLPFGVATFNEH